MTPSPMPLLLPLLLAFAPFASAQTLEESGGGAPPVGEEADAAPAPPAGQDSGPALPSASEVKKLHYANGTTKDLTPDDVLWLARMIHGETGGSPTEEEAIAMVWSMAQRSYWSPTWNKKSIATLVQNYSQPVNVKWAREGPMCKEHAGKTKELPKEHACAEHRFALRDKYRNIAWDKISPVARKAAVDFAKGASSTNVPGVVGWLAKGEWNKSKSHGTSVVAKEINRNVFIHSNDKRKIGPSGSLDTTGWTGTEVVVK